MKITRKQIRHIILEFMSLSKAQTLNEVGILHHLGLTDDEPWDPSGYFSSRLQKLQQQYDWADSDDADLDYVDEDDNPEDDEEVLQEVDLGSRDDGVDIDWQFKDGSTFRGDLEDVSPEEAFAVGYKISEEHPDYGVDGIEDDYPHKTVSDSGRMFDYGQAKSDSHEGRMTKAKLFRMAQMAQSLESQLHDGDDLPGWVQDKVTTAEDRLRSAYDYMDYKIRRMKRSGETITESKVRAMISEYLLYNR